MAKLLTPDIDTGTQMKMPTLPRPDLSLKHAQDQAAKLAENQRIKAIRDQLTAETTLRNARRFGISSLIGPASSLRTLLGVG